MFSLIRDVLMPAAPALLLIGTMVFAPSTEAEGSLRDERMAANAAAPLATEVIPDADIVPAEGRHESEEVDDAATDAGDARQCRRHERIGKFTVRRCQ